MGSGQAIWDDDDNPTRIIGSIVDIHERKTIEADIEQKTNELERTNKELEQFTYIASHNLQEPIRTKMGLVDLFLDQHGDRLNEEEHNHFKMMKDTNQRAQELIVDLMDYSQIGNEKASTPVDLNKLVKDVTEDLNANITITGARVFSEELTSVIGHETELRLLFQSLLGNALKFRNENLPLLVNIKVKAGEDSKSCTISVEDNSIGMDDRHLDTVFTIFKRLHDRTQYPETGIGLAHCKKVVELHGGKIWAESELGKGSVIHFTLPKKH